MYNLIKWGIAQAVIEREIKKMKLLSKTQKQALKKLTDKWQSSYTLQEGRNTLNALVRLELAESKSEVCGILQSRF